MVEPPEMKAGSNGASIHRKEGCIMLGTDARGIVRRINPSGVAFFGKQEDEIVGASFAHLVSPEEFDCDSRKRRFINRFLYSPEKNDSAEFETRHASGVPRRVAWTRNAKRGPGGSILEMLHLGMDVQGRPDENLDAPLSKETDSCDPDLNYGLLEKYIENSKVWAWEISAAGQLKYASSGIEKLLGISVAELIGCKIDSLLHPESEGRFLKEITEAQKSRNGKFKFQSRFRCKNGGMLWAETSGILLFDGNNTVCGARGLSWDVSREVDIKRELVSKVEDYRYLFDNIQIVLVVLDEEGIILSINKAGGHILGREPEEMVGRKMVEFITASERRGAQDAFSKAYQSARTNETNFLDIEEYMVRMENPGGTSCYLHMLPKAIRIMENDHMTGILHIALDITENQILQKELSRHEFQLQQIVDKKSEEIMTLQEEMLRYERLATLGRLTSTVSHEIRSPLGTINSSLYIINERIKGYDYGVEGAIRRGGRAVRRCDGIIEEMLDFTRTKGLEKRPIDITSCLERWLDEVEAPGTMIMERQIEPGLYAAVDARRFRRCVTNIIENSIEALKDVQGGIVRVDAVMPRRRLEIRISDNGPGVPKRIQKRVFDPLYSTKQNGIGMGLPVCRQVMELHGGSIHLRSEPDSGTTVILSLPVLSQAIDRAPEGIKTDELLE